MIDYIDSIIMARALCYRYDGPEEMSLLRLYLSVLLSVLITPSVILISSAYPRVHCWLTLPDPAQLHTWILFPFAELPLVKSKHSATD